MTLNLPAWALRTPQSGDLEETRAAHGRGMLNITWPDLKALRSWAKDHAWPTPWFGFEEAFVTRMFENEANFGQALTESGITLHMPVHEHTISRAQIEGFDTLYSEQSEYGHHTGWGVLVEELREIRRAIEAGVIVHIEGAETLRSWQAFYTWAHGNYHALEDGYDSWIGDDR